MTSSYRKTILYFPCMLILTVICFWWCRGLDAAASVSANEVINPPIQGGITFGSRSYRWTAGDICPIGVYAGSEAPIGSYEICLEYDMDMLRYQDGASEQSGNLLYIRGSGSNTSYKNMLHFEPLKSGNTTIRVVSAVCMTVSDEENGVEAQEMEMKQAFLAQITIIAQIGNGVSDLLVSPVGITFSPDSLDYEVQVKADVEELIVEYTLEDEKAEAVLSDTTLSTGENIITLTVRGSDPEPLIYTIRVLRAEEDSPETNAVLPLEPSQPEPSQTESTDKEERIQPDTEAISGAETETNSWAETNGIWIGLLLMLILIAAVWFGYPVIRKRIRKSIKKRIRKRIRKRRQRSGDEEDTDFHMLDLEDKVIEVRNVTMRFRMAKEESSSLKEFLIRTIKGQNHYRMLTALKDISFEVNQGDVLGIIGTNGSGKSTLLKIITGVLAPSEGQVLTDNRKIQMLTLGTGFDMELTAKENVYLNGAIIGYTREYIDERYDDIVAFAELEGFMDEKMKNFSSGMVSRLGFAIATMRDAPDILILDEVLSVGDMFFRKKSEKRIRELIHSGATVLIVSHSMDTIRKNCNKVVWIEKGVLKMTGPPAEVCDAYAKKVAE